MVNLRAPRLFELSPCWALWGSHLVGFDLSLTAALRLQGVNDSCVDVSEHEQLSCHLAHMLRAVPPGALLRFYGLEIACYRQDLQRYRNHFAAPGMGQKIAYEKAAQCASHLAPIKRQLYCTVSTPPALPKRLMWTPAQLHGRAHKMGQGVSRLLVAQRAQLTQATGSIGGTLQAAGMGVQLLDGPALFRMLWRMANPQRSQLFEAPEIRPTASLRAQLFASGMFNCLDYFERDGQLHRVVSLKLLPRDVTPGQILCLQRLPFRNMLVVTLRQVPPAQAYARIENVRDAALKWRQILPRLIGQERAAANPDPLVEDKQHHGNATLQHLHHGDALVEVAVQVWFCAADRPGLDRQTEYLLAAFRACSNAEAAVEEYRSQFAYLGMLPGHHAWLGDRYQTLLGSRAADLMPVFELPPGAVRPSYLLTTPQRSLFGWDPFMPGLSAHNATVLGTTGKGKSFFVRLILTGFIAQGGRVIVVTRGTDYHRYASVLGGCVHDVALQDPHLALGPFLPPSMLCGPKGRGRLVHLSNILGLMAASAHAPLGRVARRLIFQTCVQLYRQLQGHVDTSPTLLQWLQTLRALPVHSPRDVAARQTLDDEMTYWTSGPAASVFARNQKVTAAKLSVWNLAPLEDDDTCGVVLGLISSAIAQSIQKGPTVVVFDEVWSFINGEAGAHLVSSLYRTVRKDGSCIWSVSQSIHDITQLVPQLRSGMLNNAPISIFLQQKPSEVSDIQAVFQLTQKQTELLSGLRARVGYLSDALLLLGDVRQVVTLVPTPTEYWLATSHPKDLQAEAKVMRAYPHHSRGAVMGALAAQYPHGAQVAHG